MHSGCSPLAYCTSGALQYFLEPFGRNAPPPPPKSAAKLLLAECRVHAPARSSRLGRYADLSFELEVQPKGLQDGVAGMLNYPLAKPAKSFVFSAPTHAELQRWLAAFRESQAPQHSRRVQRGEVFSGSADQASLSSGVTTEGVQEPQTPSAAGNHVAALTRTPSVDLMGRQPATHLEHMESAVCQDRWINGWTDRWRDKWVDG